ncbi:MAG: AraC family transcriptional regulator [Lentisphaeria bacterium]|nr:AraC family transcriptional regulator [Lentisphaeria bacterium]NLZ59538.1 helix-turn-helix transcriptional regulator [Lentisphaerota bacterium]
MSKAGVINYTSHELQLPPIRIIQHGLVRQHNQWNNSNRIAPFWRFYWNLSGGVSISFDGGKIALSPDIVLIIPANFSYASEAKNKFSQLYMHFDWDCGFNVRTPFVCSAINEMKMFANIWHWYENDAHFFSLRMYSILFKYLADILGEIRQTRKSDRRILKAIAIINSNLKVSNQELARALHTSMDNFQRLFKLETGTTPHQYLIARRMEKAQSLLTEGEQCIEQIAIACGYQNRYQFSKAFTKFFKTPPAALRNRLKS